MTKRKMFFCMVSAVAVLSGSAVTLAQDKPTRGEGVEERLQKRSAKDFKARGAKIGQFTVFPRLSIIEEYNDNVFLTATNPKDDFKTTVNPTVKVSSDFSNHSLGFNAGAKVVRWMTHTDDDIENYDVGANGTVDVTRDVKINLSASYKLSHEDRGSPNAVNGKTPTETDTKNLKAGLTYRPGKLLVSASTTFDQKDYDDVISSTGTITNNDDRDRDEWTIDGKIGYEYLPKTEAYINATYSDITYDVEAATDDNGEDRDSTGYSVVVGTGLDFTGITTGQVFAGYQSRDYEDVNLKNTTGYKVGAGLRTKFTESTLGRLNIGRTITETSTANVSGMMSSNATVRINHEFRRNFLGRIKAKVALTDYNGSGRKDYSYTGNAGVRYLFNRNFAMGFEYEYKAKDSNAAGNDWTNNKIRVDVGVQF